VEADYVAGSDAKDLIDPEHAVWRGATRHAVELMGTPVGLQPTQLIRSAWTDEKIGAVERVTVSALHDGHALVLRLEWADPDENRDHGDNTSFPDAAALAFPAAPNAPLMTMGEPGAPITAWYWSANGGHRQISAEGIGSSELIDTTSVDAAGVWRKGRWRVCIGRSLEVKSARPVVQLAAGGSTKFGVAIWEGGRGERGGIKAFSGPNWLDLALAKEGGV